MDFGLLPPEINSGRMYTGPGPGPMLAAATAWDGLAVELHATAAGYASELSALTGAWSGPSSTSMASAAAPYVAWMSATAVHAELAGAQARLAIAAYEAAFAATVPPPVIAANRAQLMVLIATNIFGQNTPAIMMTEAQYMEMWAQDAAAMYGYAGSSATASRMTAFTEPPQTTNHGQLGAQSSAVAQTAATAAGGNLQSAFPQLLSAVPRALQGPGIADRITVGIGDAAVGYRPGEPVHLPGRGGHRPVHLSRGIASLRGAIPVRHSERLGNPKRAGGKRLAWQDRGETNHRSVGSAGRICFAYTNFGFGGLGWWIGFRGYWPGRLGRKAIGASGLDGGRPGDPIAGGGVAGDAPGRRADCGHDGAGALLGGMALSGLAGRAAAGSTGHPIGSAAAPAVGAAAAAVEDLATEANIFVIPAMDD